MKAYGMTGSRCGCSEGEGERKGCVILSVVKKRLS